MTRSASTRCCSSRVRRRSMSRSLATGSNLQPHLHFFRRFPQVLQLDFKLGAAGIDENAKDLGRWLELAQQLQPLCIKLRGQTRRAGRVAARLVQARDQAALHRIGDGGEDDGDVLGCFVCCERGDVTARCDDHVDPATDQFGGERRQPLKVVAGPAILDLGGLAVDKAPFRQTLVERLELLAGSKTRSAAAQYANHWKRQLLRTQRRRRGRNSTGNRQSKEELSHRNDLVNVRTIAQQPSARRMSDN